MEWLLQSCHALTIPSTWVLLSEYEHPFQFQIHFFFPLWWHIFIFHCVLNSHLQSSDPQCKLWLNSSFPHVWGVMLESQDGTALQRNGRLFHLEPGLARIASFISLMSSEQLLTRWCWLPQMKVKLTVPFALSKSLQVFPSFHSGHPNTNIRSKLEKCWWFYNLLGSIKADLSNKPT